MMVLTAAGAAILLAAAFVSDIRTMRIPNRLNVTALAAGLLCHAAAGAWSGWQEAASASGAWLGALQAAGRGLSEACAGAGAGFALLLLPYMLGAVGGGDVKLFAALGSWIGAREALDCAVYSMLAAGAYGLACLAIGKRRAARWRLLREDAVQGGPSAEAVSAADGATSADGDGGNGGLRKSRFPFMIAVVPGAIAAWIW
ncbi:prepilin peptidase [Thermobacillus sp. ZCTH02-B1]|uniref:A24 family peptidase n=1 Tax=Thermobacillus sp. ZCTH02-B1 TaxID=1858795 RepID=UPI0025D829DC|nr:A24 family peptidase [Thermobacillus sp. ZCTH02-B1]